MSRKSIQLKAGAIITIGVLFATFSFYGYQMAMTPNVQLEKEDAYLYIPTGATFETVKDSLEKNDNLNDRVSFYFLSKLLKYQENVKPGRYLLEKNSSNLKAIRKLSRGIQSPVKLTFNNIRLKEEFAEKMGHKLEFSKAELLKILNNQDSVSQFGLDTTTVMTMFLPNTYEVYWNVKAEDFLERMYNEYEDFWNPERKKKAEEMGLTPIQVTILASIVEAETNKDAERSRVAGVYINRLRSNMPLQADPTVKFAVGDFSLKRIYSGHLSLDSPYNTYKYTGLPPGPINLPSITSIDAVLNYEKHKYLYFCANSKLNGYHDFAETYEKHRINAENYRRALNKLKIK